MIAIVGIDGFLLSQIRSTNLPELGSMGGLKRKAVVAVTARTSKRGERQTGVRLEGQKRQQKKETRRAKEAPFQLLASKGKQTPFEAESVSMRVEHHYKTLLAMFMTFVEQFQLLIDGPSNVDCALCDYAHFLWLEGMEVDDFSKMLAA